MRLVGRRVLAPALLAQCICFRYALRTQGRASCRDAGRRRGVVSRGLRPGDRAALASSFSTSVRRLLATCRRGRAGASRDSSTVASQTRRQDRATQLSSSALRHRARARLSLPPRPSSNDREWPPLELQHSSSYSLRTSSRGEKRIGIAQLCLSISQLVMIFVTLIRKIVFAMASGTPLRGTCHRRDVSHATLASPIGYTCMRRDPGKYISAELIDGVITTVWVLAAFVTSLGRQVRELEPWLGEKARSLRWSDPAANWVWVVAWSGVAS